LPGIQETFRLEAAQSAFNQDQEANLPIQDQIASPPLCQAREPAF
jgi:hypothetical protein